MSTFRVWAPGADRVDVVVDGDRRAMERADGGWWAVDVEGAAPGTDYAFCVDGGDPRPDPRSPWQPEGVLGPSRLVDHAAFDWTDQRWRGVPVAGAVIYELHVGTFTPEGTFDAAISKLGHLVDLGVDTVELLPVAEFAGERGWGYDGVDLFAPHHAYGGPDGLKRLVDACHAAGLAVVMDVVYNHLGPSGNFLGQFGPYFTDRYATPWGDAVNFDDEDSDEVRAFVVDNALMWLRDYHCDGLRLDAVHAIVDTSATHILEEIGLAVERLSAHLGRTLFVIAESDLNDPRVVTRREAGGYGLDAQWSDDFHHALHVTLTGESDGYYADFAEVAPLAPLAKALSQAFVYDGCYSPHRRRRHGRAPVGLAAARFLGYLQNHDQIGNRAAGERSSHLMSPERLKIAAALVLTSPFVPMLFQGEEWGASTPFQYFTDHEPELGRAVSEGRRSEFSAFGWAPESVPDPQDPQTFRRSKLDWDELGREPHAGLLEWHRQLIALRRRVPALTNGAFPTVTVHGDATLVVNRGPVTVACNLSADPVTVPDGARGVSPPVEVLVSHPAAQVAGGDLRLAPESVAVVFQAP